VADTVCLDILKNLHAHSGEDPDDMFQQDRLSPHFQKVVTREIGWDGVDLIDMAQDRDQWRALVNTVLNLRVP
jgi:hypothetical protein